MVSQIDIKYSQTLFCPKSSSRQGVGSWEGMALFTPPEVCVTSETRCEEVEVPLGVPPPLGSASPPPLSKAGSCHRARGGFVPSETPNDYIWMVWSQGCGCFLGLGISEGTCTSSSSPAHNGTASRQGSSSPRLPEEPPRRDWEEIPSRRTGAGTLLSRKAIPKKSRHRKH